LGNNLTHKLQQIRKTEKRNRKNKMRKKSSISPIKPEDKPFFLSLPRNTIRGKERKGKESYGGC